ncbi:MAG: RecX family transcriptional regulator [Chloroflexi bacterium]|nr:RecX family transcriptional regulator [Chloroflexota bacterium]
MRITSLEQIKKGELAVTLDGSTRLILAGGAVPSVLKVGMELSPGEVLELDRLDNLYRAHQVALRYLSYRSRSEKEVRDRLRKGRFKAEVIEDELLRLKGLSLVDDAAFAVSWKEAREASRPRSRRVMAMELRRKGIGNELAVNVVSEVDEEAGAYAVAAKKARTSAGLAEKVLVEKLGQFLVRRGYGYELSKRVAQRVAQERVSG